MTVPAFTPTRFSMVALTAALVAYAAGARTAPTYPVDLAQIHYSIDALGQGNGTLTSNFFVSSYTPPPLGLGITPLGTSRHDKQPLAR